MRVRSAAVAALVVLAGALGARPAHASFHLNKVVEIFPGTAAAPDAQYVVLQAYFSGQEFVSNRILHFYDSQGNDVLSYTIPHDVAVGNDQSKILFATAAAQTFFGTAGFADFVIPGTPIHPEGGKVCFEGGPSFPVTLDCVAWGNYSGSAVGVGTPFRAFIGLSSRQAAQRRLD